MVAGLHLFCCAVGMLPDLPVSRLWLLDACHFVGSFGSLVPECSAARLPSPMPAWVRHTDSTPTCHGHEQSSDEAARFVSGQSGLAVSKAWALMLTRMHAGCCNWQEEVGSRCWLPTRVCI